MIVRISNAVLLAANTDQSIAAKLRSVFSLFENGKHSWGPLDNNNPRLFRTEELSGFKQYLRDVVEKDFKEREVDRSKPRTSPRVAVTLVTDVELSDLSTGKIPGSLTARAEGKRITLEHDARLEEFIHPCLVDTFLSLPLELVVEDIASDGDFFKWVYRLIANEDIGKLHIKFANGGGDGTFKTLEERGAVARVLCIVDGDTLAPGLTDPNKEATHQRLKERCSEYGFQLFILDKREIENYIPDEALIDFLGEHIRGHAYFSFGDVQKDHFDLKKGYDPSKFQSRGLPLEAVRQIAASGCMPPVAVSGFDPKGKRQLSKAIERVQTAEQLKSRDYDKELWSLVAVIRRYA